MGRSIPPLPGLLGQEELIYDTLSDPQRKIEGERAIIASTSTYALKSHIKLILIKFSLIIKAINSIPHFYARLLLLFTHILALSEETG